MSEIDNENLVDSVDEIEEEVPKVRRRKDGTFRKGVSGNKTGRPRGAKSKLSEARLTTLLNKYGAYAAEKIVEIADKEFTKGNMSSAMKGYAIVFDKYFTAVQKQQTQEAKELEAATKKLVEDDEDETPVYQAVEFKTSVS